MIGVYMIINKMNHKIYIGESFDIKQRLKQHKQDLTNNNQKVFNRVNGRQTIYEVIILFYIIYAFL